tara:strand:- start:2 stop:259 length:258 start_codon:yes stop_codon:yes gene_type:complete
LENKYNRHYAIGMFANGSKIKSIAYPPNTKPKYQSHPSTRNTIHMYITLENGQFLLDEELILDRKKWEALQKAEKFISDISGGIA